MGCVASKLEEEEEVVSICKERKQYLKLAVERRYTLADAHYKYCQALYGVSAALKLFVARHSTPSSPYLITFPPPCCPSSPGMLRTWKIMLESHEIQNKIIFDVKSFTCPTYGKFCNDSHRLATLQLDIELQNWRARFQDYIAAQKAYVEALHGWLSKFTVPEVEFYSKSRSSTPACRADGPPLLMVCRDWLSGMNNLPDKAVSVALKSFHRELPSWFGCQKMTMA